MWFVNSLNNQMKLNKASEATAEMIERAMTDDPRYAARVGNGFCMTVVPDFDGAFHSAVAKAKPGDTVLLSPACASFDAFPNFEVRGRHFKTLVHGLSDSNM